MAPDRPDASGIETACGLTVTRVFSFDDPMLTLKEADSANSERNSASTIDVVASSLDTVNNLSVAKSPSELGSAITTKQNQSDDDLTSLAWLHQQNLLKGLEISSPTKSIKDEHIINNNNNLCEDSAELSENTNSISSLDDSYFAGKEKINCVFIFLFDMINS